MTHSSKTVEIWSANILLYILLTKIISRLLVETAAVAVTVAIAVAISVTISVIVAISVVIAIAIAIITVIAITISVLGSLFENNPKKKRDSTSKSTSQQNQPN